MIELKRYEARIEKINGKPHVAYYAIPKKGEEIRMPDCYSDMYDDDHLAIEMQHLDRPELFDLDVSDVYAPLYTGGSV